MPDIAIVIPCYNESQRLALGRFKEYMEGEENVFFIFVDDGSSDGTGDILGRFCGELPGKARLVRLARNSGKAEAVRRGALTAIDDGFEFIGYWDADLSTPLYLINRLAGILEEKGVDMVLGSRVKIMGKDIRRRAARHYLGRVFATFASLTLRLPVYDTQCGAKIFRNTDSIREVFGEPFKTGWIFDVEILARYLVAEGEKTGASPAAKIVEYPLDEWRDVPGSKLKLWSFIRAAASLGRVFLEYTPKLRGG